MFSINSWVVIQFKKDVCDFISCVYVVLEGVFYVKYMFCNEVYKYEVECNYWR